MSNVLPFKHPVIEAFKQAVELNWGGPIPNVVRRSNKRWVIKGADGESRPYTLNEIKRFTWAISLGGGRSNSGTGN